MLPITTPTLIVDPEKAKKNIRKMAQKARASNMTFRPHFKTHQSKQVGQWFRDEGVDKITVSSLRMAAYFAEDGWKDITVAFPTNILEIDRINQLAATIKLGLVVESMATASFLAKQLTQAVDVYIKIDLGYHRTGIAVEEVPTIYKLIEHINAAPKMTFKGVLAHAGDTYHTSGLEGIRQTHTKSIAALGRLHFALNEKYPSLIYSIGDTPSCSTMSTFGVANEMRPGNFVYYDLMQLFIGACTIEEIAVAMYCPVVAKHPARNEIIIYGGGVHFAKDVLQHPTYGPCYGLVTKATNSSPFGALIPYTFLQKVSQEHGTIKGSDTFVEQCQIGDILKVLPIHSCMTADVLKQVQTTDGEQIAMMRWGKKITSST